MRKQKALGDNLKYSQNKCRCSCRFLSLGGEIGSRLAYTQKSEGQNLPERPAPIGFWSNGLLDSWNAGRRAFPNDPLIQQSITPFFCLVV
jgi:hypothetical protein